MPIPYKPKILVTVTVAETVHSFLKEQIHYLLERGFSVEVACGEGNWIKLADLRQTFNVPIHKVPFTRSMNVISDVHSLFKLLELFLKIRPDVLHTSTPKASLLSLFAAWACRVPVRIYLIRGITYQHTLGVTRMFYFLAQKLACYFSHAVLCVSDSNKNYLIANKLCNVEKVTVLGNGSSHGVDAAGMFNPAKVDPGIVAEYRKRYSLEADDVVFGFVGRLVKDKGIEDLVDVWADFIKTHKDSRLFIVGQREVRNSVSRSSLLAIDSLPSIHLVTDSIDPLYYYYLFDIFVFPSYREGFPNAVLEASAASLPIITNDALGCTDSVIDGLTGYIVPLGDFSSLSAKMELLHSDKQLRKRLGQNGRRRALDLYNPKNICVQLDNYIHDQMKKPRRPLNLRLAIVSTVPTTLYHLFSNQIKRLQQEGFKLTLITSPGDAWISARDVESKYGITIHTLPFHRTYSFFSDVISFVFLCVSLQRLRINMIYYCTPKASLISALSAFIMRVPFRVYSNFGLVYYGKSGFTEKVLLAAEKLTCLCSHKVILMSESNKIYMANRYLCHPSKMILLGKGSNQGVDAQDKFNRIKIKQEEIGRLKNTLRISDNKIVFGYIGRLVKDKGIIELIEAWKDVNKSMMSQLLIIGPRNEPRDRLPLKIYSDIETIDGIQLIEQVSDPRVYYACMDVFILPSYREGFPNVVLEAAAMELPVITTDAIGCIDSVHDGETGFIVPVKNAKKLAEKMLLLGHNSELRKSMGKKGRQWVLKAFNPEIITSELVRLLKTRVPA
jgi:glycosyltransferase involved in cell wall biosynthesis